MKLFILIFAFYYCINNARCNSVFFENNNFPFERRTIYPFETHGLVQFESRDAKPISVPPININIIPNSQFVVNKSAGISGRVRMFPIDGMTTISLTGGVVFNDEYVLDRLTYLVDGVSNGHIGGIIDGKSVPLEHAFFFRKKSYKTFRNASMFADGFISLTIPILVEENGWDNSDFKNMEKILYQMRSPNASAIYVSTEEAAGWLLQSLTRVNAFFSFPVTLENTINPEQPLRQCVISLKPAIPRSQYLSISKRQFEQYLRILKDNGKPITTVFSTFPLGKRPLVKAYTRVFLTNNYY